MRTSVVLVLALLLSGCVKQDAPPTTPVPAGDPLDAVFKDQDFVAYEGPGAILTWHLAAPPNRDAVGAVLLKLTVPTQVHRSSGSGGTILFAPVAAFWNATACAPIPEAIRIRSSVVPAIAPAERLGLQGNYTPGYYLAVAMGRGAVSFMLNTTNSKAPEVNVTAMTPAWVRGDTKDARAENVVGPQHHQLPLPNADGAWFGYARMSAQGPNAATASTYRVWFNDGCAPAQRDARVGLNQASQVVTQAHGPAGPIVAHGQYTPENDLSGPRTHNLVVTWVVVKRPPGAP